ncbi:MAG: lipid-binding SYLF domain-containing protein [Pyrinomonadaceae bacterium]|jgi:lipid-binding SYLF domain-containing protein|nr:lipid-binding SYLF domain-containing protein [Pyrinomonadaceae bacterium]
MRNSFQRGTAWTLGIVFMLSLMQTFAPAQRNRTTPNNKDVREATRKANDAARVFTQLMGTPESEIPRDVLSRAEAVAIFPGVLQAAFGIGGRGGAGVISRRTSSGWSAPAFFKIGGASIGAQIGASRTDYVLLFMNTGAVDSLLQDKVELGGEVGIVAGPYGRRTSASTTPSLDAGILSYSRSKGAYIGAAIRGVVLNQDNDLNRALYGGKTAGNILAPNMAMSMRQIPVTVRIVPQTLTRYSARRASR